MALPAFALAAALLGPSGGPPGPAAAPQGDEPPAGGTARVERRVAALGTLLVLDVEAADRATAAAASEAALRAVEAADARLSTWRDDTELARLNRAPVGEAFPLSPALARDLAAAARWVRASGGAFDPGVGALVRAWGLRTGGRRAPEDEIAAALAAGGMAALELGPLESGRAAAVRTHPALEIEEGAFGKGAALDDALAALRAAGATRALLDLGGQIAVLGAGPREVAIAHPAERARPLVRVALAGGSLATSGASERGVVVDGELLSHVLDPRTGRPAPAFGSATALAPTATDADCASTALYVLGPDEGLAWAAAQEDLEALFLVLGEDGRVRARATAGLRPLLAPLEELPIEFAGAPPSTGAGTPPRPPQENR